MSFVKMEPLIRMSDNSISLAIKNNTEIIQGTKSETVVQMKRIKPKAIPEAIISNKGLIAAISLLPSNYNFEIYKSVWRIQKEKVKVIAIQFPEGLLMYSLITTSSRYF